MKRTRMRNALTRTAVLSLSLGGMAAGTVMAAQAAGAAASAPVYTCSAETTGVGGYSFCTPGTYGVEHRVHLRCADGKWHWGPWVGATSRSYASCGWLSGSDYAVAVWRNQDF
ncbi:hypothetical protein ACFOY4_35895 [Actinomadura syzygii]|uniref:Uncharacterized protein n=1 Tax=Actinomadura syzygii TaxID=1427538 RepID=A0A5D0TUB0_9ACTN|nr:hypothetical protein [Actinomadura syzygii]TYC08902.1 hypothetical protein FXF65_35840 [Actinomadura syzygii]